MSTNVFLQLSKSVKIALGLIGSVERMLKRFPNKSVNRIPHGGTDVAGCGWALSFRRMPFDSIPRYFDLMARLSILIKLYINCVPMIDKSNKEGTRPIKRKEERKKLFHRKLYVWLWTVSVGVNSCVSHYWQMTQRLVCNIWHADFSVIQCFVTLCTEVLRIHTARRSSSSVIRKFSRTGPSQEC